MWRARRQGFFKRSYEITADETPVALLAVLRREGCEFELSGVAYRIERQTRRRFELHGPEGRLAVAERETGRKWRISAQGGNVQLVRPSIWRSHWEIHQRGSAQGTIRHEGMTHRTVSAGLPDDLPRPVAIFAFYVVLMIFQRQASAAAAAG